MAGSSHPECRRSSFFSSRIWLRSWLTSDSSRELACVTSMHRLSSWRVCSFFLRRHLLAATRLRSRNRSRFCCSTALWVGEKTGSLGRRCA